MQPGVYVNFMSGDEEDRVKEAYNERWDRLVAVKSHYDHRNFFRWEPEHPADSDVAQSVKKENETSREF